MLAMPILSCWPTQTVLQLVKTSPTALAIVASRLSLDRRAASHQLAPDGSTALNGYVLVRRVWFQLGQQDRERRAFSQ